MVEDRVTDGERVAQLLASELSGRSDGELDRFSVVDADPDAEPTPEGTVAYRIAVDGDRTRIVGTLERWRMPLPEEPLPEPDTDDRRPGAAALADRPVGVGDAGGYRSPSSGER